MSGKVNQSTGRSAPVLSSPKQAEAAKVVADSAPATAPLTERTNKRAGKISSSGHWRVVSGGTQFNPWPDKNGKSSQLSAADGLKDGMKDGAGWTRREQVQVD